MTQEQIRHYQSIVPECRTNTARVAAGLSPTNLWGLATNKAAVKVTAIVYARMNSICEDMVRGRGDPQLEAVLRIVQSFGTYRIGKHYDSGFWAMCHAAIEEPEWYALSIVGGHLLSTKVSTEDLKLATGWSRQELDAQIDRHRDLYLSPNYAFVS